MTIIETKLDESPQGQYRYYMNKNKDWLASELVSKNKQLKALSEQLSVRLKGGSNGN